MDGDMIYVSSLSALDSVAATLASFDLLTLLSPDHPPAEWSGPARGRHLRLAFHDIVEPVAGLIQPDRTTVEAILGFGRARGDRRAILIHCWAGISRSSAAAFMIACDHNAGLRAGYRRRAAPPCAVRHAEPVDGATGG